MTSIELFRPTPPSTSVPPDWGTGKVGEQDLWVPRPATFNMLGKPPDQNYTLTQLKLSNVRDNDELIPRPQGVQIGKKVINKPFPAEHPYSSHIEQFAMIPKFDSPNDPKRGVAARNQQPISDEMPANAYNVRIEKKIKGFPYRHETQCLPTEGKKEALYWQGEHFFDQQSKLHGNRPQYYPIPIKQMCPNLQDRPAELQISDRSQNVLRNIERNQWIPTHHLDYTGLGPANPMALDNLDNKKAKHYETGEWDDKLYPRSVNTFDPARPLEGRMKQLFRPKPAQQMMIESGLSANPDHRRKLTLSEIEEDRLLNGKEYVNLPGDPCDPQKDRRWQEMDQTTRAGPALEKLEAAQKEAREGQEFEVPEPTLKVEEPEFDYLTLRKEKMRSDIQGMEAQNRWKVLELGTPKHDVAQLQEKYKILKPKELPSTYYRHEGKYNEERAGLYKTSYDPQRLAYSMNSQALSGGTLFNTSMSHVNAGAYPTILWDENEAALKDSHTVVFKNSELSGDRPSTGEMLDPYRETVALQRLSLQPTVATARPRTQEGEFVLREDTYGDSYNTKKFLQENVLDRNIRMEPKDLISHENQNLERTRERSAPAKGPATLGKLKAVSFAENVNVQNFHENYPVKIGESHIISLSAAEREEMGETFGDGNVQALSYNQTHPEYCPSLGSLTLAGDTRNISDSLKNRPAVPTVVARNTEPVYRQREVTFTRKPQLKPPPLSETTDVFRSLSTNFMPSGLKHDTGLKTSYSCQFPVFDLSEKKDKRFQWEPGCGRPRPQSCLLEMQDSFIKSELRKKFHRTFPETNPEIRMNINTGKKHSFFGMNAQVIHG